MPILKINKNGVWQDIATADEHTHTVSDIADLPASLVDDVEALKDKVGASSVAYQISTAIVEVNKHPDEHPASMITGLSDVATSGSYNDLTDLPAIPSSYNDLADLPAIPSIDGLATENYVDERIASIGGKVEQVQADWSETDETSPSFIKNKPNISNGDGGGSADAVLYTPQTLTDEQKAQARENIGITPDMFENTGGGGSGSSSVSWDDITDKPFHATNVTGTTLFDGRYGYTWSEADGMWSPEEINIPIGSGFVVGEMYNVIWKGKEYTCTCFEFDPGNGTPINIIGNGELLGREDTGEPFAMQYIHTEDISIVLFADLEEPDPSVATELYYDIKVSTYVDNVEKLDNKCLSFMDYTPAVVNEILPSVVIENFQYTSEFGSYGAAGEGYTLIVGEEYNVNWDGVDYKCIGQDTSTIIPGSIALGNCSAFGFVGNNEPFAIAVIPESQSRYLAITDTEAGNSHTVSIYQPVSEESCKIKPEYLPEKLGNNTTDAKIDVVPETDVTFMCMGGSESMGMVTFVPTPGEMYKFVLNGEEYNCVGQDEPFLGNMSLMEPSAEDTGEPFFFFNQGMMAAVMAPSITTPPTYEIYHNDTLVHKPDFVFYYNGLWGESAFTFPIKRDTTYYVEFDNTEYECVMFFDDAEGIGMLGNMSIAFDGEDTGEPFMFQCMPTPMGIVAAAPFTNVDAEPDTMHVHTIRVRENAIPVPSFAGDDEGKVLTIKDSKMSWEFVKSSESSGSTGEPMPTVSDADNGKILEVVNGVWTTVAIADSSIKTYIDDYIRSALEGDY